MNMKAEMVGCSISHRTPTAADGNTTKLGEARSRVSSLSQEEPPRSAAAAAQDTPAPLLPHFLLREHARHPARGHAPVWCCKRQWTPDRPSHVPRTS